MGYRKELWSCERIAHWLLSGMHIQIYRCFFDQPFADQHQLLQNSVARSPMFDSAYVHFSLIIDTVSVCNRPIWSLKFLGFKKVSFAAKPTYPRRDRHHKGQRIGFGDANVLGWRSHIETGCKAWLYCHHMSPTYSACRCWILQLCFHASSCGCVHAQSAQNWFSLETNEWKFKCARLIFNRGKVPLD